MMPSRCLVLSSTSHFQSTILLTLLPPDASAASVVVAVAAFDHEIDSPLHQQHGKLVMLCHFSPAARKFGTDTNVDFKMRGSVGIHII